MDATYQRLCLLMIGLCFCGCNSGTEQDASSDAGPATSQNTIVDSSENRLVGTWYGQARLDMQRVETYLNAITDPAERDDRTKIVQSFLTTEMAARFDAAGNMELDIQMQPAGMQVMRDSTRGKWSVVENLADAVVIETSEQLPAGGTETNQVRYQFGPEGNTVSMRPPVSPWLAGCNPVFVLQRMDESTARLASEPGQNGGVK